MGCVPNEWRSNVSVLPAEVTKALAAPPLASPQLETCPFSVTRCGVSGAPLASTKTSGCRCGQPMVHTPQPARLTISATPTTTDHHQAHFMV